MHPVVEPPESTGSGRVNSKTTRSSPPGPGAPPDDERSDGPERAPLEVPTADDQESDVDGQTTANEEG
jgi:hypothetical protein